MNDLVAQSLLTYLHDSTSEMVAYLTRLVEAESPSLVPESQQPIFDLLSTALADLGYRVAYIPGEESGGHLLARPAGERSGPTQLLLGHSDTVWPLGTLESMPVSLEGNRLAGPGVYDMKAGLAMMVFALKALRALDLHPTVQPLLFINSDEEVGSAESTPHITRLARTANRALVLEPAFGPEGKLKTARKGVGRFTITVHGKAAHAGLEPEKGASAIVELAHVILTLNAMNDPTRGTTINVGLVEGGRRSNVVAPQARAVVDVRVLNMEEAHRVETAIHNLQTVTTGTRLEVRGRVGRPPLARTPRNRALWERARQAASRLGLALEEATAGGGSDGNTTSQYTATLDGLGAVGDGAHADHEFVFIDRLAERCALVALLIMAPPL